MRGTKSLSDDIRGCNGLIAMAGYKYYGRLQVLTMDVGFPDDEQQVADLARTILTDRGSLPAS